MKTWAFIQLARPITPSAFAHITPFFGSASDTFKVFTDTVVIGTVSDVINDEADFSQIGSGEVRCGCDFSESLSPKKRMV